MSAPTANAVGVIDGRSYFLLIFFMFFSGISLLAFQLPMLDCPLRIYFLLVFDNFFTALFDVRLARPFACETLEHCGVWDAAHHQQLAIIYKAWRASFLALL